MDGDGHLFGLIISHMIVDDEVNRPSRCGFRVLPFLQAVLLVSPDTGRKQGTQLFSFWALQLVSPDCYISSSYMPSCHGPGFPFVGSTVPLRLNFPRFMLRCLFSCLANAAKEGKDKPLSGDQARPNHLFIVIIVSRTRDSNTRMIHDWTSHALSGDGLADSA